MRLSMRRSVQAVTSVSDRPSMSHPMRCCPSTRILDSVMLGVSHGDILQRVCCRAVKDQSHSFSLWPRGPERSEVSTGPQRPASGARRLDPVEADSAGQPAVLLAGFTTWEDRLRWVTAQEVRAWVEEQTAWASRGPWDVRRCRSVPGVSSARTRSMSIEGQAAAHPGDGEVSRLDGVVRLVEASGKTATAATQNLRRRLQNRSGGWSGWRSDDDDEVSTAADIWLAKMSGCSCSGSCRKTRKPESGTCPISCS